MQGTTSKGRAMEGRLPAELTVGFEEMDGAHRGIMAAMDEAAAHARRGDLAAARAAVASLGDLLVAHFSAEEAFMAESLYPERSRHKAAHDLFMQDFAQLGREMSGGLSDLVTQWIVTRVPEWVKFHIRVNDSQLAQYLVARRYRPRAAGPRPQKRS